MTSDTAKLKERLRDENFTHPPRGLLAEAADEIERLEAERDAVCRIIAGDTKIANLPPYIQSLCNSLDDAETERDEAVGLLKKLEDVTDSMGWAANMNMADNALEEVRSFLAKHKEAGADE